jgi:hypothetical protein
MNSNYSLESIMDILDYLLLQPDRTDYFSMVLALFGEYTTWFYLNLGLIKATESGFEVYINLQ